MCWTLKRWKNKWESPNDLCLWGVWKVPGKIVIYIYNHNPPRCPDTYAEHKRGVRMCRNSTCVLSFNIKIHVIQNCANRHAKERMDVISWKGRISRAWQLDVGYKKSKKWRLPWGFWTSSFEEQLHQLGSGRKPLAHFSGISGKRLMKGLFTNMRARRRGMYRALIVCWTSNRAAKASACLAQEEQGKEAVTEGGSAPNRSRGLSQRNSASPVSTCRHGHWEINISTPLFSRSWRPSTDTTPKPEGKGAQWPGH